MGNSDRPIPTTCGACAGRVVLIDEWYVCVGCGGANTRSGKYLPPKSGWRIPTVPHKVFVWQNGAILAFDPFGDQVGRFQRNIESVDPEAIATLATLDRIIPMREWKYRIWSETAAGMATPKWITGRALEIRAHYARQGDGHFTYPVARDAAINEAEHGKLFMEPRDI